jgi:hypothetical protein
MTEPAAGQTWRSRDKREQRTVTVERVEDSFVYVRSVRRSRVRRHLFVRAYELSGDGCDD